jgi:hypothetical protein
MVEMVEMRKQWVGYAWFTGHGIYDKNNEPSSSFFSGINLIYIDITLFIYILPFMS